MSHVGLRVLPSGEQPVAPSLGTRCGGFGALRIQDLALQPFGEFMASPGFPWPRVPATVCALLLC